MLKGGNEGFSPIPPFARLGLRNQRMTLDGDDSRNQTEGEERKRTQSARSSSLLLFLK